MSQHGHQHGGDERDYQDRDIQIRPILIFGVVTTLFTIATFWGIHAMFIRINAREALADQPLATTERFLPPEPTLQVREEVDLQAIKIKEHAMLTEYRWMDRAKGTVVIPVERAMALALERGFPVRDVISPSNP